MSSVHEAFLLDFYLNNSWLSLVLIYFSQWGLLVNTTGFHLPVALRGISTVEMVLITRTVQYMCVCVLNECRFICGGGGGFVVAAVHKYLFDT